MPNTLMPATVATATLCVSALAVGSMAASVDATAQDPAERATKRCLDYAALKKLPPLSVAVVDQGGVLIRFIRQKGASPITAEAALLKARTAARMRAPTAPLDPKDLPTRDTFIMLQLTTVPGGIPLFNTDGSLLGAIGVSGAQVSQDADCARQAAGGAP